MTDESDSLFATILERLRSGGGRITKKRMRIVEALMIMKHPASAEEVRVQAGLPETDLVTVYRNLDALNTAGMLQRVPLENGTQLFELTAPGEHYHHLICRKCHSAQRLDLCIGSAVNSQAKAYGYSDVSHIMEVYGVCKDCDSQSDSQ
jgi:Fe2+ or Zn2+ uptake regulation protein